MPPRATAPQGRVIPLPLAAEASPPHVLRGLLHALATRLHHAGPGAFCGPWTVSGARLGRALTEGPGAVTPGYRRDLERRFMAALLADVHLLERADEIRAKWLKRDAPRPPKRPDGAA